MNLLIDVKLLLRTRVGSLRNRINKINQINQKFGINN